MPPWVKGQTGNPNGRPRVEQSIAPMLRKLLDEKDRNKTNREWVGRALVEAAKQGDVKAIALLCERVDGKMKEQVDITSKDKGIFEEVLKAVAEVEASRKRAGAETEIDNSV